MERSNKHGPRLDDTMAGETESLDRGAPVESRVEEWREAEPAGEDQHVPDAVLGMPDTELRSELAKRLRKGAFPANRQTLEQVAIEEQAPGHILDLLRRLPDGRMFDNTADIWRALGGTVEHRGRPSAG